MHPKFLSCAFLVLFLNMAVAAQSNSPSPEEITFTPDASSSSVIFSLDATMHTVHGGFAFKKSAIHFSPNLKQISGEIVLDATSAKTGIDARDNKMNKGVLESNRFPEIVFHPDRVEGALALQGTSKIQIHGVFTIHGQQHEMTVPAEVEITAQRWTVTSRFVVPYVDWGMKDPSNFLLHVKKTVDIEVKLAGKNPVTKR
jgi:polyisoprenoid-binding protein YceI